MGFAEVKDSLKKALLVDGIPVEFCGFPPMRPKDGAWMGHGEAGKLQSTSQI
jgi:hypothetical protein